MNKWILVLLFISYDVNAEFRTNIEITRLAKEAVKSVEKFLGDTSYTLVLHDIDLEFMEEDPEDVLDFKATLSKKSVLKFWIIDTKKHRINGKCADYVQYIAKLEMDKLSTFVIDVGEYRDCTDDKLAPHDMLDGVNK